MEAAEARRAAVAVILAALDGRHDDLHILLADAGREELAIAVGGMALAVGAMSGELPPERRAEIREQLAHHALTVAGS